VAICIDSYYPDTIKEVDEQVDFPMCADPKVEFNVSPVPTSFRARFQFTLGLNYKFLLDKSGRLVAMMDALDEKGLERWLQKLLPDTEHQ
jgi:hypothetical protein